MPYPTNYDRSYSFTAFSAGQGDNSFPGTKLDAELDTIETALDEITAFLELLAAPDGTLNNETVGIEQLTAAVRAAIGQPATLDDYEDDEAAASGGVPVGGFYRTGSAVKVRVS